MITCKEAFDRGFAVMVYSINQEKELNFAYKDKIFTLERTPELMEKLIRKDGMSFLPVSDNAAWVVSVGHFMERHNNTEFAYGKKASMSGLHK